MTEQNRSKLASLKFPFAFIPAGIIGASQNESKLKRKEPDLTT